MPWYLALAASLLLAPLVMCWVDMVGPLRAKLRRPPRLAPGASADFNVLVPIYGSIDYLENVDYLRDYGDRVVLCTTGDETAHFYQRLTAIAEANGFGVFYGAAGAARGRTVGRRDTGGTTRDRLVRDALQTLTASYVVCIDADTVTERPLEDLVASMASRGLDIASVPLHPGNQSNWLTRIQRHEYRLAMSLRRVMPWMVCGGCHAGRTHALAHVMREHSLFFQGNDIEIGVLAKKLGYTVGHVPFPVPTAVPSTPSAWLRQRCAWAGGEFRLFIVNAGTALRHPFLWLYGIVIMFLGLPLRWYAITVDPLAVLGVLIVYLMFVLAISWSARDRWLLALPLYAAFTSLFLLAIALPAYARMAVRSRNSGRIRIGRPARRRRASGVRPPGPAVFRGD